MKSAPTVRPIVGRPPWSAAGPLAGFFVHPILSPNSGSRGTRADQGVCPTQVQS